MSLPLIKLDGARSRSDHWEKRQPYSPTPYGFDRICDLLVKKHDEQKVIEEILELRKKGWSLREIARALNLSGVPAKNGGLWHASAVRSVLATHSL